MIVPIVYSLDPYKENLLQCWVFYKAVTYAKKNKSMLIAQSQYFEEIELQQRVMPHIFKQSECDIYEYDMPNRADFDEIEYIKIPKEMEERYVEQYSSQSDACISLYQSSWPELEEYLYDEIKRIEGVMGEKVEAVTVLTHLKFAYNLAERMGITCIYYENGPFRQSVYRNTCYFDVDKQFYSVKNAYHTFLEEDGIQQLPILSKKEILALFLTYENLDKIYQPRADKQYEMGISAGYTCIYETNAYTNVSLFDMYNNARKNFTDQSIAVRYHPTDPLKGRISGPVEFAGGLQDFLLSCKRIVGVATNVEFEAALYGAKVYDMGKTTYRMGEMANNDFVNLPDNEPDLLFLNFYAFVVLAPFEVLNSTEYIRYRLEKPLLSDVYMRHLTYYMDSLGIPMNVLQEKERLDNIIQYRKNALPMESVEKDAILKKKIQEYQRDNLEKAYRKLKEDFAFLESDYQNNLRQNRELVQRIEELDKRNDELDKEKGVSINKILELEQIIDTMQNSKSWKLTKPLRNVATTFTRGE